MTVFLGSMLAVDHSAGMLRAQTLYGITFGPGDQLLTINTATGVGTTVGPLSSNMDAYGIAFRGTKLYAYDELASRIRELNPATGATLNTINIGAVTLGEGDLVFRNDGIGFLSNIIPPFQLIRFDLTAPSSAVVGPLSQPLDGLAFNSAGVLYGLDQLAGNLYTVNPATGALTLVGPTGISKYTVNALGGLAFDASDNLYAAVSSNNFPPIGPSELYKINPATGAATLIGNIGINGVAGIRFSAPAGVSIVESGGSTAVAEGGATDSYTVALNSVPLANVTITANPGPQLSVVPATLTFTSGNWNVPQVISVSAVDDGVFEGPHSGTILHTATSADPAYNGIAIASVTATIADNDVFAPPFNGGNGEGSYQGFGFFGFGGRNVRTTPLPPVLQGPTAEDSVVRVRNISQQQGPSVDADGDTDIGLVGWSVLSTLGVGVIVLASRKA